MQAVDECLCCQSKKLAFIYSLRDAPLTDHYTPTSEESRLLPKFPLHLYLCNSCGHLQLGHHVSPQLSYQNYLYKSSITIGLNTNFVDYASSLKDFHKGSDPYNLLDIGSNDGTFLNACQHIGISAFGVEPASAPSDVANSNHLPTIQSFFDEKLPINAQAQDIQLPNKFDMITFNNVLANLPSPRESLSLAKSYLKDSTSLIAVQTGYHPLQFSRGLFDYVYHEHFSYYSIHSISQLAFSCGLKVVNISTSNLRGGTIRFFLSDISSTDYKQCDVPLERFITPSELINLYQLVSYSSQLLHKQLQTLKADGYSIVGYGASHSTGILVHHFGITDYIDYLVDENLDKLSMFMPGTQHKVQSPDIIYSIGKVAIVVLAWQYFDQILSKLSDRGFKGPVLKPVLP